MPFVSIRIAGAVTKAQKAGIVADVTGSLVARLGKNPAAVQIVIEEIDTENYGAGGILIADRAPTPSSDAQPQEVALADGKR
jgi:4-oxalocrotonate tautomerase